MKKTAITAVFTVDMKLKTASTPEQFEAFSKEMENILALWKTQCEVIAINAGLQPQTVHFSLDYLSEDSFDAETNDMS